MGIGILMVFMVSLVYKGRNRIHEALLRYKNKITKKKPEKWNKIALIALIPAIKGFLYQYVLLNTQQGLKKKVLKPHLI